MGVLKKILWKVIYYWYPEKYAQKKGVRMGTGNSFVDHPNFGSEPYLVSMGNHNRISFECSFVTHDGGRWVLDHLYPEEAPFVKIKPIVLGNNIFIGARTIINPGVSIGDNCVIAAGSIVTKSIPSGEVWGGVPAKYIMTVQEYREKLLHNKDEFDLAELSRDKEKTLRKHFKI